MSLEKDLFERLIPNYERLEKYGFIKDNNTYTYKASFLDDDFYCVITIENDELTGKVYDSFSDEEYTLIHMTKSTGAFAAKVREAYVNILEDIAKNCFRQSNFIQHQSRRIEKLIYAIYRLEPTFPYKGERENEAVFKEGKVFVIISETDAFNKTNEEVLNVKVKEELLAPLLEKEGIYKTHLKNRKDWVSIPLNDAIEDEILLELIKYSYALTRTTNERTGIKEWIVPSSSDFDVDGYLSQEEVWWRQTTDIRVGDIVYIYVAKPYSCLLYKCEAVRVNMPNPYESTPTRKRRAMILHPLVRFDEEDYPLSLLRRYNVKYIRGPRFMPQELSDLINGR